MLYKFSPLTIFFALSALFLLFLSAYLYLNKNKKGGVIFSILMLLNALWTFSALMENAATDLPAKIFWSKVGYIGSLSVGPLWLMFCMYFANYKKSIIRKVSIAAWIIALIFFIIVWTNEIHNLVWTSFSYINDSIDNGVIYHHGILFFANVSNSYLGLLVGCFVLARYYFKTNKIEKRQIVILIGALIFPWIFNLAYVLVGAEYLEGVDLTPLSFTLTGFIISFGIFRYKLLSIIPFAQSLVFESIEIGMLIIDKNMSVLESNETAEKLFLNTFVLKSDIRDLKFKGDFDLKNLIETDTGSEYTIQTTDTKKWYAIKASKFYSKKNEFSGWIIYFKDITEQKKILTDLEKKVDELSKLNNIMIARELKMVELKKEIAQLKDK